MTGEQARKLVTRRVLVISSYVASGTVGLQATLPALPGQDFEVIAIPTVVLSNHPGHKNCAGTAIAPQTLSEMTEALDGNGWLHGLDAIFTGYVPSADHVAWAARTVERVKTLNPSALYIADPVLGDDPGGLYISRAAAEAVRDGLLPLADLATPNRFELAWLTGMSVTDRASAIVATRSLNRPRLAATSIPDGPDRLANLLVTASGSEIAAVPRHDHAPHGTGDYFAGVILAEILRGASDREALNTATSQTATAIAASADGRHLIFDR